MRIGKTRLDQLLVDRGLVETRSRAQALILAGEVLVQGAPAGKPGQTVPDDSLLELKNRPRFVSRGGEKLEAALEEWQVDARGRVCIDVGSSTGGFTDCLLQRGASRVYAVDSGSHQLDGRLRSDSRVTVMEKTNARLLEPLDPAPDLAVMDVSFISIRLLMPMLLERLAAPREVVSLVKPQFEAGVHLVGRGGRVRPEDHLGVLSDLFAELTAGGWSMRALRVSPIRGLKSGNIEYLARFLPGDSCEGIDPAEMTRAAVEAALKMRDETDG